MVDPRFKDVKMLICGNDSNAKTKVTNIVKTFVWAGAIDIGGISEARWLEAHTMLWTLVGIALNT